ncbi:MAG: PAS domain S-box protein [Desulfobacterales bacterium]|nr:PAS domain S-box protein [Desulfobacterales bacterium]
MIKTLLIFVAFPVSLILLASSLCYCLSLRRQLKKQNNGAPPAIKDQSRAISDSLSDPVILYDPQRDHIEYFNPALCDLLGYSKDELNELGFDALYTGDYPYTRENAFKKHEKALYGQPQNFEWPIQVKNGTPIWVEMTLKRILLCDHPFLLIGLRDITGRTKTEHRLRWLTRIVDQLGEGVATCDLNGIIQYVNQAWADMHGYSPQTLKGKNISIFHTDEQYINQVVPINRKVLRHGYHSGETGHQRSDGTQFSTNMTTTLQRDESGRAIGYISMATDLSDQKKVESALRESEVKFRHLFNLSPQPISLTDLNGRIIDVNEKFCELSRYSRNEVIGRNSLDLGFPPETRQTFIQRLTQEGEVSGFEIEIPVKNGEIFYIQLFSKLIEIHGQFYGLTVYHDLTPQRMLEAQLIRSQKMEAIGTLAGGIAHDFNNILAAILGYVELAKMQATENSKLAGYLEQVFKAGNRAKEVVQQILAISRQTHQKRQPVNFSQIIKDVNKLLRATLPASIEIFEDIQEHKMLVEADPGQMHQVLMNLCTNAGQAMRSKDGTLTIRLAQESLDDQNGLGLSAGAYLKLTVSDTGCGIKPEDRERIFDPYYTTKDKGVGTGLGLAVAKGIIEKHGGRIHFSSAADVGTDFHVFLPRLESSDDYSLEAAPVATDSLPSGTERILFVDDERAITDTVRQMLEHLGYSVTARDSSERAIKDFSSRPNDFDLVITDMIMPETNGDILIQRLLEVRPELPVILCTGYNSTIDEKSAEEMGVAALLLKPLTLKDLAITVRNVLGARN